MSWILPCQKSGKDLRKVLLPSPNVWLPHSTIKFVGFFFWNWGRKMTRDFSPLFLVITMQDSLHVFQAVLPYLYGFLKRLCFVIYLIPIGRLCHSSRCADGQLWIYWEGKWSCKNPVNATSYSTEASHCMMLPPFKSRLSSLLQVCFLHYS